MLKLNHSQQAIVNALKFGDAKTRKELCSASGFSWAAVSKTVTQLQTMGIITSEEELHSTEKGRRPARILLNDKAYMAGVAINRDRIEVAVFSLNHIRIAFESAELSKDDDPVPVAVSLLREVLKPKIWQNLFSIGIAFPGIIEGNKRYVESSTHFPDFEDRPIGEEIKLSLGIDVPVFVERNAVCDLTYLVINKQIDKDTILLSLKSGVSAAVFVDGKILHGKSGNIGELGHLNSPNGEIACVCGKIGCIETEIGGIAWTRQYARLKRKDDKIISFYEAVEKAEPTALNLLQNSFKALFPVLGHLTLLLRPEILAFSTHLPPSATLIAATIISNESKAQKIKQVPKVCLLDEISTVAGAANICLLWLSGNKHYQAKGK